MFGQRRGKAGYWDGFAAFCLLILLVSCGPAVPGLNTPPVILFTATPPMERTPVVLVPTLTQLPLPSATVSPAPTDGAGDSDLPDYYGGLVITLDSVGQTIFMKPGQGFLLQLGDSFEWEITVEPPILTINSKITPQPGEQGVYIAREKGKATLQAMGAPTCLRSNPPCLRPNVLFTLYVVIK